MTPRTATLRLVRLGSIVVAAVGLAGVFSDTVTGTPMSDAVGVVAEVAPTAAARAFELGRSVVADTANSAAASFTAATGAGLAEPVLGLALTAASCAATRGVVSAPETLTVIDYSLPSTQPRLWVIDLQTKALLYRELVAHGKNTGENMARRFSNQLNSLQTSLGLFVTEDTYVGSNGYSLRLNGLERGVNDRARARAIVIHGAPYVNAENAKTLGRLGRSWGCPALRAPIAREVIDRIKGGSLVFSYYPDQDWLSQSEFLGNCS